MYALTYLSLHLDLLRPAGVMKQPALLSSVRRMTSPPHHHLDLIFLFRTPHGDPTYLNHDLRFLLHQVVVIRRNGTEFISQASHTHPTTHERLRLPISLPASASFHLDRDLGSIRSPWGGFSLAETHEPCMPCPARH